MLVTNVASTTSSDAPRQQRKRDSLWLASTPWALEGRPHFNIQIPCFQPIEREDEARVVRRGKFLVPLESYRASFA